MKWSKKIPKESHVGRLFVVRHEVGKNTKYTDIGALRIELGELVIVSHSLAALKMYAFMDMDYLQKHNAEFLGPLPE